MANKRHIVLYALGAVVLLVAAVVFLVLKKDELSDRREAQDLATTTGIVATPSGGRVAPEVVQPAPAPFRFEVVTSPEAQARGLGGRAEIPSNYGMFFVFPNKEIRNFWMKDMLAAIDIIWISDAGIVVGIEEAVSPDTYPEQFRSPEPVRYVLETRSGEARRLGITVGTKLNLPLPYGR